MNRRLSQFQLTYEIAPVDSHVKISFGSTGAPTLVKGQNGILSVSRVSAGRYTLLLKDNFNYLMNAQAIFLSSAAPAAPECRVVADNSALAVGLANVIIQFSAAGVATDPASGEVVLISLIFKNSSV